MSMAMLEALAAGLPVVTVPCGGEEAVRAGTNGQVCSIQEMPSVIRNFMINGCDPVAVRKLVEGLRPSAIAEKFLKEIFE
jgi:glycosyltransferase involved in cell wall biosynthesis